MKIKQTKIIITGGSSGFGHLLASYFSQNFYHVTILDIKKSKLKNVNFIRIDLSKKINQNILTKLNLKSAEKVVFDQLCYFGRVKVYQKKIIMIG